MIGPLRVSFERLFHLLADLALKGLIGAFLGAVLLTGVYVMTLIPGGLYLMVASLFGYESQSTQRERHEMYAFVAAHRQAFCHTERIPLAYCDKVFNDSAASDLAYRAWMQISQARYEKKEKDAPWWDVLEPFRDPLVKR